MDHRAVAVLGFSVGLLTALGPDALLLPLVAEALPRVLGLTVVLLLLGAGWAWAGQRGSLGRRGLLTLGLLTLVGGLGAVAALPWSRELLRSQLIDGTPWPGTALISLSCALALAPLALPLGALLGLGLQVAERRSLALFCLGCGAGVGLAPHLGEVWLGRSGALQLATLAAVAAAASLAESPRRHCGGRLPRGALPGLTFVSLMIALCSDLGAPLIDIGPFGSTWLVALALLGAALGLALRGASPRTLFHGLALLGLVPLLGLQPLSAAAGASGIAADWATLALLALPLGAFAGRSLALSGGGPAAPGWALPVMAGLPATAVLLLGLPLLGPVATTALAGLALGLGALSLAGRPQPRSLVVTLSLGALLPWLPLPSAVEGLPADALLHSRHGILTRVSDPLDGSPRLAIDGRAELGTSALSRRRRVHLPFLLHGHAERALLVASDLGQAVEAARQHEPEALDWLRPVPAPWSAPRTFAGPEPGPNPLEAHGNERLHLAQQHDDYDLIVYLPDPRGRSRARLTGTREFFEENAAALGPKGLFCQWWSLSAVDITDLKGIIGGALAAFKHTALIIDHPRTRHGVIGILGSHTPLRLRPDLIDAALARQPAVAADWDAVGLDGLMTCCLVVQHEGVLQLLTPSERGLSDARATLGVRGGLREMAQPTTTRLGMETLCTRRCSPWPWIAVPPAVREQTRIHVRDVQRGWQHLLGGAQKTVAALGLSCLPFDTEAPGQLPEIEAKGFVQALASLADWPYLVQLVLDMSASMETRGQLAEAEQYLRRAVSEAPTLASLRFALAALVERQGDLDDACELYGTVLAFDPDHAGALAALARLCGDD